MNFELLLYKTRALRGLGLLDVARETLTGTLRRRRARFEEVLRELRYERALLYQDFSQPRGHVASSTSSAGCRRVYAEDPDYEDVGARLGL